MKFLALIFTASVLLLSTSSASASPSLGATLSASPAAFSGGCPKTITFNGTITARNWSPTALRRVDFKFIRSDGANAPVQSLTFPTIAGGTRNVSTTWMLGASYRGWEAIKIIYPQSATSAHANFSLTCSGGSGGPVMHVPISGSATSVLGPPTPPRHVPTPRPRQNNGTAPTGGDKLTPQQRVIVARKVAAMKQRMATMRAHVKVAVLAKKAQWERQQIAHRIQLWNAIAPRLQPKAQAAVSNIVYHLNTLNVRIASLNPPIAIFEQLQGVRPFGPPPAPPNGGNGGCSAPQITDATSEGGPGNPIAINGSGFGSNPGAVSFVVNPGNTVQATTIDYWSNTQIVTSVPPVSGIASPYAGVVYVSTCAQSNVEPFQFDPELLIEQLPITQANAAWADSNCPTNSLALFWSVEWGCGIDQGTASAGAMGGPASGTKGDDQFFSGYQLKHNWVLDSAILDNPGSNPANGSTVATANINTSSPFVDVHWWVNLDGVESYTLTIYIHGPVGVPYQ